MGTLNVDPGHMKSDSAAFSDIAGVAERIGSYMRHALALLGDFSGNDKVGKTFKEQWNPGTEGLLSTFSGFGEGMIATADGINTSADLYTTSDVVNAESVPGTGSVRK